jgi:hypothetical protein
MPNRRGNAYALTTLCPLVGGSKDDQSAAALVRAYLRRVHLDHASPMAKVPNTYLCRFFVLDDVIYQGHPARLDRLKSRYLVFVAEIHGELEPYLRGMWENAQGFVRGVWQYCVGFASQADDADGFVRYIKRCQVETTFYFNGSTDESLEAQLKSLYLKQEFSKFAFANQGKSPAELQQAFTEFIVRVAPSDPKGPTWAAGASSLDVLEARPPPARGSTDP